MRFEELKNNSIELRKKFEELEKKTCGHPWGKTELTAAFMADVGQLSKLIMVKEGLRTDQSYTDEKLAHELADCLWCVIVLANECKIDLEQALVEMIKKDGQKIDNLLNK